MQNEIDVKRFEEEMKNQFPEATVEEVLKLAELGKAVLNVSDDLAGDLMFVTEQVLKSDEGLVHDIRYCLSSLPALTRCVHEYKNSTRQEDI